VSGPYCCADGGPADDRPSPTARGVLALTVGDVGAASDPPPQSTPAPRPCATPQHRQFDFWLGDWDVTKPDGKAAGHNRVSVILGGCALREEWTGASGTHGTSLNMFDAGAHKWRQTWVDDGGTVLLLTGEFKGGKMVLEGDSAASGGATVRQRITWTPQPGGSASALGVVGRRREELEGPSSTGCTRNRRDSGAGLCVAGRCRRGGPCGRRISHSAAQGEGGRAAPTAPKTLAAASPPTPRGSRGPRLQPLQHSGVLGDHRPIVEGGFS
jgi:hypothetical protein